MCLQSIPTPHLKYRAHRPCSKHYGQIELKGEVVHKIENLDDFHKSFGYTLEFAKAGILPDEFIWEKYIKDSAADCNSCFQLNIIDYLIKHSASFRKKYAEKYGDWIAAHASTKAACNENCACNESLCKT